MRANSGPATKCSTSACWTRPTEHRPCSGCCFRAASARTTRCWGALTATAGTAPASWSRRCRWTGRATAPSSWTCAPRRGERPWSRASTGRPCACCTSAVAIATCCRSSAAVSACLPGTTRRPQAPLTPSHSGRTSSTSTGSMSGTWTATRCRRRRGPWRGSCTRRGPSTRSASGGSQRPRSMSSTASSCCPSAPGARQPTRAAAAPMRQTPAPR
mmetsp:Transcript_1488/g.4506  ORF Transcript_1488/g.4506 Transcript_1488/m.4506 type:complete len:215 (+) Transcript_1488:191-835(+)